MANAITDATRKTQDSKNAMSHPLLRAEEGYLQKQKGLKYMADKGLKFKSTYLFSSNIYKYHPVVPLILI